MHRQKQIWITIEQEDVFDYLRNCSVIERADFLIRALNSLAVCGMPDVARAHPDKVEAIARGCRTLLERAEQVKGKQDDR